MFTRSLVAALLIAAPAIFGYVSETYGWRAVFVLTAVTYVLCAISWLFINSTIPVLREEEVSNNPT